MKSVLIIVISFIVFGTTRSFSQGTNSLDSAKEESWGSRFTRRKIEESTLFKLGFKSMGMQSKRPKGTPRRAYDIILETSVEYKFSPLVSFNLKAKNNFGNRGFDSDGNLYPDFDVKPFYNVDLSPEIRFYLSMQKGIEKGKRGNNFTGKFIVIQFDELINIGRTNIKRPKINLLFGNKTKVREVWIYRFHAWAFI